MLLNKNSNTSPTGTRAPKGRMLSNKIISSLRSIQINKYIKYNYSMQYNARINRIHINNKYSMIWMHINNCLFLPSLLLAL